VSRCHSDLLETGGRRAVLEKRTGAAVPCHAGDEDEAVRGRAAQYGTREEEKRRRAVLEMRL